jgi:protein Mpv17
MDEMTSMGRSDSYGSMLDVDDVYVGGVEMGASNAHVVPPPPPPSSSSSKSSKTMMMTTTMTTSSVVSAISGLLKAAGGAYVRLLTRRPILTKSLTAGLIFGLSDVCAQFIEGGRASDEGEGKETKAAIISSSRVLDASIDAFSRVLAASLVGILFFGPAAHYWYEAIFRLLPSTSLLSTLQKALLGQIFFGPAFTAVFFGAGMVRHGDFTLGGWYDKVRCDLPAVWRAGLGYWPLVDFISYKIVPVRWIPLFVNFCSFVWTIYLSVVSNDK